ncbi:MAG TPA: hypothetical protein VFS52_08670 [Steroidobacteraceae bacterium]|jgi:hypothetical protein|nr:hypothetical protein [Steroidobacteraceae bacterium]
MRIPAETLDDMTRALGAAECASYRICQQKFGPQALAERGFDPKTLTVLNLVLRTQQSAGAYPQHALFLSGDGRGNYYFVPVGDPIGKVLLWTRDPPGIEATGEPLIEFLQRAEQRTRILAEPAPGDVYIARTEVPGESILDPIEMEEWRAVVARTPALEYRGYRRGRNPYTGEELRFDCPGGAVARHGTREVLFRLYAGRICASDLEPSFDPLLQSLADLLHAHVIRG